MKTTGWEDFSLSPTLQADGEVGLSRLPLGPSEFLRPHEGDLEGLLWLPSLGHSVALRPSKMEGESVLLQPEWWGVGGVVGGSFRK